MTPFRGQNWAEGANACFEQRADRRVVVVVGCAIVGQSPIAGAVIAMTLAG
ncbi:MAG: hypothetical protein ACYCVN_15060 [Acidimicrobiales bacterium]